MNILACNVTCRCRSVLVSVISLVLCSRFVLDVLVLQQMCTRLTFVWAWNHNLFITLCTGFMERRECR